MMSSREPLEWRSDYLGSLRCDYFVVTEHQRRRALSMAVYRIRISSGFLHHSLDRPVGGALDAVLRRLHREARGIYWACPTCSA
jgi:hypothetical protein